MTTQVDFYVLKKSAQTDKDNYACRIANLAFGRGHKVYVQTDDAARAETVNKTLWMFSQNSFVPHALCGDGDVHDAKKYPVQIGCGDAPDDCAEVLISLKQSAPADYARFARVVELIIEDAADKKAARDRFRFYREQDIKPNTHDVE